MSREAGRKMEIEKVWRSGVIADVHKGSFGTTVVVSYRGSQPKPSDQPKLAILLPMGKEAAQSLRSLSAQLMPGVKVEWLDDSDATLNLGAGSESMDQLPIKDFRIALT